MLHTDPQFPMILTYAVPFFVVTIALEWFFVSKQALKGRYVFKDAITSMIMGLGNFISDLIFGVISLGFLFWLWQFRIIDLGYSVGVIFIALILQDFVYYWKHRAAHRIRWFWSAHVVHHSSEHYNLSTALRQPWNNHFTGYILLSTPLILIGFHPLLIGFVGSVNLLYQFWIHTEAIKHMPKWFETILNTPSHHRAHHATHPRYLDSNFAGIFIIWDKMFGTFVPELENEPIIYGVVTPINTFNPVKIAFGEWINIFKDIFARKLTLKQRLLYAFAPPGYSHDGTRKDSQALKQAYIDQFPEQAGTPGLPQATSPTLSQTAKKGTLL